MPNFLTTTLLKLRYPTTGNKISDFVAICTAMMQDVDAALGQSNFKPGNVKMSAGGAESGWLFCQGQAVGRSAYPALFAAIGTSFGAGDNSTTFNVPDYRMRFPTGPGAGTAQSNGGPVTQWQVGAQPLSGAGGEINHKQTLYELATHGHDVAVDLSGGWLGSPSILSISFDGPAAGQQTGTFSDRYGDADSPQNFIDQVGSGEPASLLPPVSVINFLIKT